MSDHSIITVCPMSDHGIITMRPMSNHGIFTVRPMSNHGIITVRPMSNHGIFTVHPMSNHGSITVHPMSDHGIITMHPSSNYSTTVDPISDHGIITVYPISDHGMTTMYPFRLFIVFHACVQSRHCHQVSPLRYWQYYFYHYIITVHPVFDHNIVIVHSFVWSHHFQYFFFRSRYSHRWPLSLIMAFSACIPCTVYSDIPPMYLILYHNIVTMHCSQVSDHSISHVHRSRSNVLLLCTTAWSITAFPFVLLPWWQYCMR